MENALTIREDNWLDVRSTASEVPMPYRKEILLDEVEVDGTLHIDDILAKTEHLSVGDAVVLKRDLTSKENPLAVSIENSAGECIGALPKKFSAPYAHLLDAGKFLGNVAKLGMNISIAGQDSCRSARALTRSTGGISGFFAGCAGGPAHNGVCAPSQTLRH